MLWMKNVEKPGGLFSPIRKQFTNFHFQNFWSFHKKNWVVIRKKKKIFKLKFKLDNLKCNFYC